MPYNLVPRLNEAFARSGLSHAAVAQKAGMSWPQLWKILRGKRPHLAADTLRRVAVALDVSTDYLLGLSNDPQR
jgi:transcriptional regulator with XRE-family HTH domain